MAKPWGQKITLVVYIEGELPAPQLPLVAAKELERGLRETYDPKIDFVGVSVEEQAEKPESQDA